MLGQPGLDQQGQPEAGVRRADQLDQLVAHPLGGDDLDPRRPCRVIAATTASSTVKPSWAANRAARIIRSGSSEKESSGRPGVRSSRCARSTTPPYGSSKSRLGHAHRHRVDREVAAAEVAGQGVAEVDVRLARGGVVGLGAVRRDLDQPVALAAADGAEVAAHVPVARRAQPLQDPLGLLGPRRRREVEVVVRAARASRRAPVRRPAPARGRPPRTARPSSSMTGAIRSSSAPTGRWTSAIWSGGGGDSGTTEQSRPDAGEAGLDPSGWSLARSGDAR